MQTQKSQRLKVEPLAYDSHLRNTIPATDSRSFMQCSETIGANIHLLHLALVDKCAFRDVRYETPVDGVFRVTYGMPIHGALAADIAALCHC